VTPARRRATPARAAAAAAPGGLAPEIAIALLLAAVTLAVAPAVARPSTSVEVERFHGVARGRDGAVAYREEHEVRRLGDRPLQAVTTYRDAAGEVLAVLRTDFSRDPFAPDYTFEDRRRTAVEAVEVTERGATLAAGSRRRTVPLPGEPGRRLVTGQGLDRLVRARLADLERGAELHVAFAIPSRQATYDFRVRALPSPPDSPTLLVRVEIDSWVLRLFASSLDSEYDRATGRLVRYRGLSNLVDERGDNPEVTITYTYPEASAPGKEEIRASL
jgi:hypothetical protein